MAPKPPKTPHFVCPRRDYNKYFDAMPTRVISGAQNAEFVKFSSAALKAAQSKLSQFLQLVPREELQKAFDQNAALLQ